MVNNDPNCEACGEASRRKFIAVAGTAGVFGLTGCSGGGSSDEASSGSDGSGGSSANDGSDGAGSSGGDSSGEEQEFPEFSVEDPQYPQPWPVMIENDYQFGLESDLEQMEPRNEAVYGQSPAETPDDESEWIDPDTIEFAYFPSENPGAMRTRSRHSSKTSRPKLDGR